MFAKVAINIPTDTLFSYRIPVHLEAFAQVGTRVWVPFGFRRCAGFIVGINETIALAEERIKDISDFIDATPLINATDIAFYNWLAEYYIYPLGKLLFELLPATAKHSEKFSFNTTIPTNFSLCGEQREIVELISSKGKSVSLDVIKKIFPHKNIVTILHELESNGIVKKYSPAPPTVMPMEGDTLQLIAPLSPQCIRGRQDRAVLALLTERKEISIGELKNSFPNIVRIAKRLEAKGTVAITKEQHPIKVKAERKHQLNEQQEEAYAELIQGIKSQKFTTYLLHGITGSGKTEVYLRVIEQVLAENGSALYLVPEIALTPQLEAEIRHRFSVPIAVIHSSISSKKRLEQWERISRGEIRLVIGARSAIFAPLRGLKVIVVDEEHDGSYKQEDRMRYNARDAAIVRAKMNSAVAILGSATPSLQSFYNAGEAKYRYLALTNRVENRPLPAVEIVDLRAEGSEIPLISPKLRMAIEQTMAKGKQAILFLNRRGFNSTTLCPSCGEAVKCPACDMNLTLHRHDNHLECHLCGFSRLPLASCPHCGFANLITYGAGTEKLSAEVAKLFPQARVQRMDSDTMKGAGVLQTLLTDFSKGKLDIMIGTQMVAKGHDFPNVTLVGIILADIGMGLPDFRAMERSFQFLMQVAGRSGRGVDQGKVIIQTLKPKHHTILQALEHNYNGFYQREIADRKQHGFPPFERLISVSFYSNSQEKGGTAMQNLKAELDLCPSRGVELIGPTPAPIFKVKGSYHWRLLIKGKNSNILNSYARMALQIANRHKIKATPDVDPMSFF
ncbi:MAG: primosomal protein N' [Deltaproteobacteria bacterium]|nr:primosomal protein N' [Deltaproteobacteria bacterium]